MSSLEEIRRGITVLAFGALITAAPAARAQVTPAAGYTPPDDTPSVKVGGLIYTDFTYQDEPTTKDADGNTIHPNAFDVSRAYINVTGNISHLVSFRITPDIKRLQTASKLAPGESVSNSLDGSLTFRIKYAFGQLNLDDWLTKGSFVRLGAQQTPLIDYLEGIYRYRFQGTTFTNREGYLDSSDFGLSVHYNLPNNYGDLHVGVYNGELFGKAEANDQKAFEIRGTLRPLPKQAVLKGLRLTAFYSGDKYVKDGPRNRFVANAGFEHKYLNAGFEYLNATDRTSINAAEVKANGYSIWATPKSKVGVEGLLRYDSLKPNKSVDARKNRTIVGVAYWFKTKASSVSAAVLADYEHVSYDAALAKPDETRYALHTQFGF